MAFGTIDTNESDIKLGPDGVIGLCEGTLPSGTEFQVRDGKIYLENFGVFDKLADPTEEEEVRLALENQFSRPTRILLRKGGERELILLSTSPKSSGPTLADSFRRQIWERTKTAAGFTDAATPQARNRVNQLAASVPRTETNQWEKLLAHRGIFSLIRLRQQSSAPEPDILAEVKGLLSGETDPKRMAKYAMDRVKDPHFSDPQAEKFAALNQLYRPARKMIEAGKKGGEVEAALITQIEDPSMKGPGVSKAEARNIAQAAIRSAREYITLDERIKWVKGPGLNGLKKLGKYSAGALAVATLGVVGAPTLAAVIALKYGSKALKYGWEKAKAAAPYVLATGGKLIKGGIAITAGVLKTARNALIYTPARILSTAATRSYQGLRAAINLPKPATQKRRKGPLRPFAVVGNFFRSGLQNAKRAALLAPALALSLSIGLGEGLAKGIAHDVGGAQWNGSRLIDQFMNKHAHASAPVIDEDHGAPSDSAGHAPAPAAHGHDSHGGH